MRQIKFFVLIIFVLVLLASCRSEQVIPDVTMFELVVHVPKTINANQIVDIAVDIKNKSNYKWVGIHGLDLFKYKVKDNEGMEVLTFDGIRAIDSLAIGLNIEKNDTFSFYKSELYQENLNQLTIIKPGIYTLEVISDFRIEHQEEIYPIEIKSEPIDIIIQ